jgi:hypothetical protein
MKFIKLQESNNFDYRKLENKVLHSVDVLVAFINNEVTEIASVSTHKPKTSTGMERIYSHFYLNHEGIIISLIGSAKGCGYNKIDAALEDALLYAQPKQKDIQLEGYVKPYSALEAVAEFFNIEHFTIISK